MFIKAHANTSCLGIEIGMVRSVLVLLYLELMYHVCLMHDSESDLHLGTVDDGRRPAPGFGLRSSDCRCPRPKPGKPHNPNHNCHTSCKQKYTHDHTCHSQPTFQPRRRSREPFAPARIHAHLSQPTACHCHRSACRHDNVSRGGTRAHAKLSSSCGLFLKRYSAM